MRAFLTRLSASFRLHLPSRPSTYLDMPRVCDDRFARKASRNPRKLFLRLPLVIFGVVYSLAFVVPLRAAATPTDPLFSEQWYLRQVRAPEAWSVTRGVPEVIVAVIDSGVDEDHEDIFENFWVNTREVADDGVDNDGNGYVDDARGWDFFTDTPSPNAKFQSIEEVQARPLGAHHGTIISGLIAAQENGKGIIGIAPSVRVMPLRALTSRGLGSVYTITRAINYAVANGADVINLSFNVDIESGVLIAALRRAWEAGVVVVAAAGNDSDLGQGVDTDVYPTYPVCAHGPQGEDYVIGVAASDATNAKAPFSHFGTRCVDIVAPGTGMVATQVHSPRFGFGEYYSRGWSGTSFAAALVSGAAALVKSVNPALSPDAVRAILQETAFDVRGVDHVYGAKLGAGLMNVEAAVVRARETLQGKPMIVSSASELLATAPRIAITFSDGKSGTQLGIVDLEGVRAATWYPFGSAYRGNATVRTGDVTRDGNDEVFVIGGKGGGPHVRVFDRTGSFEGSFFAYEPSFRGGASVAVGDPAPTGDREVVIIPAGGRDVEARVFSSSGKQQLSYLPFDGSTARGGTVAIGDVDGDGLDDIVYMSYGVRAQVRVADVFGAELFSFIAYDEDVGDAGLAVADTDGDGIREIITSRGQGLPEIRVWKRGVLAQTFLAYASSFRHGVSIGAGDVDRNGKDEIVAVPRANGGAHVRIFSGSGELEHQFFAREKSWRGAMTVAVVE